MERLILQCSFYVFCEHSGLFLIEAPWQAKICDFWLKMSIQQDIFRFQIHMNYACFMKIMHSLANSLDYFVTHIPLGTMWIFCRSEETSTQMIYAFTYKKWFPLREALTVLYPGMQKFCGGCLTFLCTSDTL